MGTRKTVAGMFCKASVAVLAMVALTSAASAAPKCAKPDEVTAIQASAIQQELMVAALTCNEISRFNAFQTSFAAELRSFDGRLEHMFHRLYGNRRGEAEYHAFKTRLANDSSMRSIKNNTDYCREAALAFDAALASVKPTLQAFVAGVPVTEHGPVDSCTVRVREGMNGAIASPSVVPQPNPLHVAGR